jgi:hypothetical protein
MLTPTINPIYISRAKGETDSQTLEQIYNKTDRQMDGQTHRKVDNRLYS